MHGGSMNIVLLAALVGLLLLLSVKMKVGEKKFRQAARMEKEGRFREACYFYSVAIFNGLGTMAQADCENRIKTLWRSHGPFDYADIDVQACRVNAQGHSETLKIIKELVT